MLYLLKDTYMFIYLINSMLTHSITNKLYIYLIKDDPVHATV